MSMRLLLRYKRILLATVILFIVFIIVIRNIYKTTSAQDARPSLAVLVPFRDRFDELIMFVPNLSRFLHSQNIWQFHIYILNQSNRYRFNRGSLANVGFLLARNHSDYIAIHDVDLLPLNRNLSYSFPVTGPHHLSAPEYHPQYNYDKYFGGVLLITNEHFLRVNGMSNRYFGWGLEDDEFYTRIKAANLTITRPTNLSTNKNNTFLHFHYNRRRDTFKTKEQREVLRRRDRKTGLNDIKYSVTSKHNITIDGYGDCTVLNIELYCDTKQTPWCLRNYTRQSLS